MVLLDDKVMCKNMRCRKRFDDFRHQDHGVYLARRYLLIREIRAGSAAASEANAGIGVNLR